MTILSSPDRNWLAEIQPTVRGAAASGIVEAFDYGRGRQGLIPLWVGEGDQPPPACVIEAVKASLDRGEYVMPKTARKKIEQKSRERRKLRA